MIEVTTPREFVVVAHSFTMVLLKEHGIMREDSRIKEFNSFIHEGAHSMIEAQNLGGKPIDLPTMAEWSINAFRFHFPECCTLRVVTTGMVTADLEDEILDSMKEEGE